MKFLKYSILTVAAATAIAFSACSDDDYAPAVQSPGAYFPTTLASSVNISPDGSSFTVEIDRTSVSDADTYTISCVDESGLFTVPGSVTFSNGSLTADIVISYDNSALVAKQAYALTLSVDNASEFGDSSYSFDAIMRPDYTEVAFNEATDGVNGYGSYNFGAMGWGEEAYYMKKMYIDDPNDQVDVIHNFMAGFFDDEGFDFEIARNMYDLDPNTNTVPVTVEAQYIGYNHSTYGKIYIVDLGTWYETLYKTGKYELTEEDVEEAKQLSYYDVETGTFYLYVAYTIPEYGESYSVGSGYDKFQFDGFPEGWVEVNYKGFLTTPSESYSAIAEVTAGSDVSIIRAAMFEGSDALAGVNAILAGTAENVQAITSFDSDEATQITFDFDNAGTYTIVAVSIDSNNEMMEYDYTTFEVNIGPKEWNSIGTCEFADPWITPGYGYDNTQYSFYVAMKQNIADPNIYALVDPYHSSTFWLADENTSTSSRNIQIDLTDSYVFIEPQLISFTNSAFTGDANYVANLEGRLRYSNPDVDKETIIAYIEQNAGLQVGSYEDGLVTITNPFFIFPGVTGSSSSFYSWTANPDGLILMPNATQSAKRKAKAMRVAAPKIKGYKVSMGYNATEKFQIHIPVSFDQVKAPKRLKK